MPTNLLAKIIIIAVTNITEIPYNYESAKQATGFKSKAVITEVFDVRTLVFAFEGKEYKQAVDREKVSCIIERFDLVQPEATWEKISTVPACEWWTEPGEYYGSNWIRDLVLTNVVATNCTATLRGPIPPETYWHLTNLLEYVNPTYAIPYPYYHRPHPVLILETNTP